MITSMDCLDQDPWLRFLKNKRWLYMFGISSCSVDLCVHALLYKFHLWNDVIMCACICVLPIDCFPKSDTLLVNDDLSSSYCPEWLHTCIVACKRIMINACILPQGPNPIFSKYLGIYYTHDYSNLITLSEIFSDTKIIQL